MSDLRVRYLGHVGKPTSGYGIAAYETLTALVRAGAELEIQLLPDARVDLIPERYSHLVEHLTPRSPGWATHTILHAVPAALPGFRQLSRSNGNTLAMTTWETSRVTGESVEILQSFDGVIVPCRWNAYVMQEAGIERVWKLPHPFDPTFWHAPRPVRECYCDRDPCDEPYVFYWIGTWSERKNPIGLLKAYWTAFREGENVLLRMVTPNYNHAEVEGVRVGFELPDRLAPVEFISGLSDVDLRQLHWASDCYVTVSRGEGWGLGAFEAALVGNPVIAPCYGGFLDFLGLDYKLADTYWVNCQETPAIAPPTVSENAIEVAGLRIRPVVHHVHDGVRGDQLWAEPDLLQAARFMRSLQFRSPAPGTPWMSPFAPHPFSYEVVGKRLVEILREVG